MSTVATWPSQAETWLDERGKPAWIVAMILGFIFFWPVGLALLAYMIWSKRMFNGCSSKRRRPRRSDDYSAPRGAHRTPDTGNLTFDTYKAETLARLESEQAAFEAFLERLRDAKDKSEFDDFMDERAAKAKPTRLKSQDQDAD